MTPILLGSALSPARLEIFVEVGPVDQGVEAAVEHRGQQHEVGDDRAHLGEDRDVIQSNIWDLHKYQIKTISLGILRNMQYNCFVLLLFTRVVPVRTILKRFIKLKV